MVRLAHLIILSVNNLRFSLCLPNTRFNDSTSRIAFQLVVDIRCITVVFIGQFYFYLFLENNDKYFHIRIVYFIS